MSDKKAADDQHNIIGVTGENDLNFQPNTHPDAQWFNSKNLGLFIHWGICNVNGDIDLSWGMMANKPYELLDGYNKFISPNQYFKLAEKFKPNNFEIGKALKLAKKAKFTYAVFTTKHHDGFALWPSKYGDFNIGNSMENTDFVRDYVEACRDNGLKVGLYYSPPDWYFFRNYMSFNYGSSFKEGEFLDYPRCEYDVDHKPTKITEAPEQLKSQYYEYIRNQIIELCTNYGKIDMLWFDGASEFAPITIAEIRQLQPSILVNPRLHKMGDFQTFECKMPAEKPAGLWEYEDIWAKGRWWAHMNGIDYRSAQWVCDRYIDVCKWDGNFLLNIGLHGDGGLPNITQTRLEELGKLMK